MDISTLDTGQDYLPDPAPMEAAPAALSSGPPAAIPPMRSTIAALLTSGKGILASEDGLEALGLRFTELGIPNTQESTGAYRNVLFTTPGLNRYMSGVTLHDESIRQHSADGIPMAEVLVRNGMVPGIKVDKGTTPLANFADELLTQGLDGLRERLLEYRALGARFAMWRAAFRVSDSLPNHACVTANAQALAQFATLSQEVGLVPVVEPEVLMDGRHSIERCEEVSTEVLRRVFAALTEQGIRLESMLLMTGMMMPGADHRAKVGVATVAEATLRCLRRTVPAAVPGIVFLPGGQHEGIASQRLCAICRIWDAPWKLSFSFGHALQAPPPAIWSGTRGAAAQTTQRHRARSSNSAIGLPAGAGDGRGRATDAEASPTTERIASGAVLVAVP